MNVLATDRRLGRRTFLRGVGTTVALPFLEAMLPSDLLPVNTLDAATRKGSPRRMAFMYVPNGMHMPSWMLTKEGALRTLPPTLAALRPFRRDLLLLGGLTQDKARANGDGPGDHARAAAAFLTGAQPYKTGGKNIKVGVSVDQVAAVRLAELTTFPSLELGIERGRNGGDQHQPRPGQGQAREHDPHQAQQDDADVAQDYAYRLRDVPELGHGNTRPSCV